MSTPQVGSPNWRRNCWIKKPVGSPCSFCGKSFRVGERIRTIHMAERFFNQTSIETLLQVILCVECETKLTTCVNELVDKIELED